VTSPQPFGVVSREVLLARSGLEFLSALVRGELPAPPICQTLGFALAEVSEGRAVFVGVPEHRHFNPIGTVHAGFAATLLDSALGCAVHSTLAKGEAYTTLELKLNLTRALTADSGEVKAEGKIIHRGRTTATAEGHLRDAAGRLCAHATTTCMIFQAGAAA
jgi:uncharacterized protein (TIGR00369 family)